MKEPIQDYATIGLVHFMLWKECIKGEGDFSSVSTLLDDPYFGGVEVSWIKDAAGRARVAQAVKQSGKALAFGAQPVLLTQKLDINHLDEAERSKAVAAVVDVMPQAVELGARGFAVLSGKNVAAADKGRAMEQLVKSLVEIGTKLKQHSDIPLVMETFDQLDYGKNCLIGPNKDAAAIAKEVRKSVPGFGLMIDLSHLPLQGESSAQAWADAGDYVVHAHMGNCVMNKPDHPMNGDEHPPLCDPDGQNCVDELADYLGVLLNNGYLNKNTRPFLSFEVCVYGDWTRDKLLAQCKETLDAAWARV
ncbi:MAG: sugar phosphate isomerase/epimerase [Spirochaetaceae bacterium]|nr:MAG: sugar phosphate isomerase/epimerase [Spirochaetaceae bacterium]